MAIMGRLKKELDQMKDTLQRLQMYRQDVILATDKRLLALIAQTNLKEKIKLLESGRLFEWGEERELLLAEMDESDFYAFLSEFQEFLKKIVKATGYG